MSSFDFAAGLTTKSLGEVTWRSFAEPAVEPLSHWAMGWSTPYIRMIKDHLKWLWYQWYPFISMYIHSRDFEIFRDDVWSKIIYNKSQAFRNQMSGRFWKPLPYYHLARSGFGRIIASTPLDTPCFNLGLWTKPQICKTVSSIENMGWKRGIVGETMIIHWV